MSIPAVSVVMPVHNARRFLHKAICSIRLQTFSDLVLIIVDDGSTDGSTEVLREHAAADPRFARLGIESRVRHFPFVPSPAHERIGRVLSHRLILQSAAERILRSSW
jgi:glycosyltransferase involved in cell wall biosynthesis